MIDERFLDSVRGGFIGLGAGDALGVPVETMSHEAIMAATGGSGITDYIAPKQLRVKDTLNLPPGSTSDDTQLARVTNRSLVRCRGFNLDDQGIGLVEEFEASTFGWGGTTTEAAKAIKLWRDSGGKQGRHPAAPAPPPSKEGSSAGSGPAMKIFPLAAYCLFGRDSDKAAAMFLAHAMDLGLMTHGDPRACIASVALGQAIAGFAAGASADRAAIIARVETAVAHAEAQYRFFRPYQPPFSSYLARAFALLDDPVALRTEVNASFLAVHSIPFAIATALRHPGDFRGGVIEAVNAGKDTDTVGSMVGAMLGSQVGLGGIPKQWIDGLREKDGIIADADALCMMMHGYDPDDAKRVIAPWDRDKLH
ncbi:MAG TPA: ADP-ribosylglycohydrolase family protein [Candidatus Eisenbacteria bacterium]|nr:ADP-ribosylglycohydrolase family protein [Candidatus Eisenbacteria bacterium]